MKSKITRIMGVALALALVLGLGVSFLPATTPGGPATAEAGELAWSTVGVPSATGNVLVARDENVGPVAISPNFATDNTVWAVVYDTVTAAALPLVYKSTDGGHTWNATTSNLGAANDVGVALVPSPNYSSDSTVFVAVQTAGGGATTGRVYRSTNGGSSFGQLGVVTLGVGEVITSMDVSPNYDGVGTIAVGVANVATLTYAAGATCVQVWGVNSVLSWQGWAPSAAPIEPTDVSAVQFSPNYPIDTTLLVVTSDAGAGGGANAMATTDPYLRAIVSGVWDVRIAATQINGTGVNALTDYAPGVGATDINAADIAIPADYNGQVSTTRRVYVTIVCQGGVTATTGNIYRVTNVSAGTPIGTTTFTAALQLSNIDYDGDFSSGTLVGGLYSRAVGTAADVYRTTNPTASVVNWYGVSGGVNMPSGLSTIATITSTYVEMSSTYSTDSTVVVGTTGTDSAFGISTNGAVSFNETGLIDNGGVGGAGNENAITMLSDVALSPDYGSDSTIFLISSNDTAVVNDTNVWVSHNGGSYWDRCFTSAFTTAAWGVLAVSDGYATDSVCYVGDGGGAATGTNIWYTANGGQSWSGRAVTGVAIQTMAAPDASTLYVGDSATGNVAKSTNSGWSWPTSLRKNSGATGAVMSLKAADSTIVVGGTAGTVRRSDDGNASWSKVDGTVTGGGNMYVAFDDDTVYAASNGNAGQIYRSVDGGSWVTLTMPGGQALANELILAEDGTLYMGDPSVVGGGGGVLDAIWRSIAPEADEPSPGTFFEAVAGLTAGATHMALDAVSGSSNIIAVLEDAAGGAFPGAIAPLRLKIYTDTLAKGDDGPGLVSPADGSTLGRGQSGVFTIDPLNKVTAYQVQWATDPDLASRATNLVINAPSVQVAQANLTEGATIYWRARSTAPLRSPWSETWTLVTQMVTAANSPNPMYPAGDDVMDISVTPIINWTSMKYADGYNLQLAKDSAMSDLLVDFTGADALGNITSYKVTTALAYETTYYWRVQALKGGIAASDWSEIVGFTTRAKPVEPAPPVVIEEAPPAPEPSTPGYIWAIIAIGAVLVIVVVVLIVRTRRVA
jgi:hypothetical protein